MWSYLKPDTTSPLLLCGRFRVYFDSLVAVYIAGIELNSSWIVKAYAARGTLQSGTQDGKPVDVPVDSARADPTLGDPIWTNGLSTLNISYLDFLHSFLGKIGSPPFVAFSISCAMCYLGP